MFKKIDCEIYNNEKNNNNNINYHSLRSLINSERNNKTGEKGKNSHCVYMDDK